MESRADTGELTGDHLHRHRERAQALQLGSLKGRSAQLGRADLYAGPALRRRVLVTSILWRTAYRAPAPADDRQVIPDGRGQAPRRILRAG